jgi:predicted Rossmann fold nucleotide-binding protein DprA/Smf involved in DNA uptake
VLLRAAAQRVGGPDIAALRAQAAASRDRAARTGLTPIAWSDAAYPAALAAIADPPFVMWTRGAVSALARPAVAIVGSGRRRTTAWRLRRGLRRILPGTVWPLSAVWHGASTPRRIEAP